MMTVKSDFYFNALFFFYLPMTPSRVNNYTETYKYYSIEPTLIFN